MALRSALPHLKTISKHGPFVVLEHVNLDLPPWSEKMQTFWYKVLAASEDSRGPTILKNIQSAPSSGTEVVDLHWANFGFQQMHLPSYARASAPSASASAAPADFSKASFARGAIGLEWPAEDCKALQDRLAASGWHYTLVNSCDARGDLAEGGQDKALELADTEGNVFRLHFVTPQTAEGHTLIGPLPRSQLLKVADSPALPSMNSAESIGLGMRYVELQIPRRVAREAGQASNAQRVAKFYESMFEAARTVVRKQAAKPELEECIIFMGHEESAQALVFVEVEAPEEAPVAAPPGAMRCEPHIAVYVNDFDDLYERAAAFEKTCLPDGAALTFPSHKVNENIEGLGLVFINPQFPHLTYHTLDEARKFNEFRIKDFVDCETGEVFFELEHEIRTLLHNGFHGNARLRATLE
eukprot:TRINITY_DN102156_c0_g1_i1.p1 TRINITY_DN102156_c0_g1~~TRINITY_DN102156_c0_g1_i1.p1  ORF type:complete len:437 (-),score=80.86 TRINITY_DN102156_c0_g1_i1:186-1424(-)